MGNICSDTDTSNKKSKTEINIKTTNKSQSSTLVLNRYQRLDEDANSNSLPKRNSSDFLGINNSSDNNASISSLSQPICQENPLYSKQSTSSLGKN